MQSVLRNIGPIAVGINGDDPSFLSYSGGTIFDSEQCSDQQANHALLIVEYGQERDTNEWNNGTYLLSVLICIYLV
jgi:hypothetical protein